MRCRFVWMVDPGLTTRQKLKLVVWVQLYLFKNVIAQTLQFDCDLAHLASANKTIDAIYNTLDDR